MKLNEFTATDQFVLNTALSVGYGYALIKEVASRGPVVIGVAGAACTIQTNDFKTRILTLKEIEGLA